MDRELESTATVFRRGRIVAAAWLSGAVWVGGGGDGGDGDVTKVGVDAVVGVSGMLTWTSLASKASPHMGSSFVRIADKFFKRGAMSSGTVPFIAAAVAASGDARSCFGLPPYDRGWVNFSKK
jgi:hypothetical protein